MVSDVTSPLNMSSGQYIIILCYSLLSAERNFTGYKFRLRPSTSLKIRFLRPPFSKSNPLVDQRPVFDAILSLSAVINSRRPMKIRPCYKSNCIERNVIGVVRYRFAYRWPYSFWEFQSRTRCFVRQIVIHEIYVRTKYYCHVKTTFFL